MGEPELLPFERGGGGTVQYQVRWEGYDYYIRYRHGSLSIDRDGIRVKTDRRDAANLARFLRSGDLTEVHVPEPATEAMTDLERCRDDAKHAERRARHQLGKFRFAMDDRRRLVAVPP